MNSENMLNIFGSSRSFTDWLQDKSNPLVYCLLTLDGKDFLAKNSYIVELHQKTNDHDTFSIETPEDALDSFEDYVMQNSRKLLTKEITITYWQYGQITQTFTGLIGAIRNKKSDGGGYGTLYITGYSPSILLENGKDCQSFEEKTLEQIITEVTENHPREAKVNVVIPNTKQTFPYTVQYKESDYQFIKRLASRYGEFFYYDGEKLLFGAQTQPTVKLGENLNLINVDFTMGIGAQDFEYSIYNVEQGTKITKNSSAIPSEFKANLFQSIGTNKSRELFTKKPKMFFNHTGINPSSSYELEQVVQLEKERRENLMYAKGKSREPLLRIGGLAELSNINTKAMETYRVIDIIHHHNGNEYYNEFVAIVNTFITGQLFERIEGDVESEVKGERNEISSKDLNLSTENNVNNHTQNVFNLNSGEKSNSF